ncbi:MAG: DinB family protein [Mucilaginibacter sp.]
MKQEKWFDRKFNFESNENIFPSIIERLLGTPARLEEKVRDIPEDILTFSTDKQWSIKENIGHLIDLEPLWQGRLADIINGEIELRPTDLQNNKTHLANHNATPLNQLLSGFREIRRQTVAALRMIEEETVFKSALHPRLKTPMRTMDLFIFVAEHDDHHLATITGLLTANGHDIS